MHKFINNPDNLTEELLEGYVMAYSDHDWRRSFRHDDRNYGRKTWIVRYRLRTYG